MDQGRQPRRPADRERLGSLAAGRNHANAVFSSLASVVFSPCREILGFLATARRIGNLKRCFALGNPLDRPVGSGAGGRSKVRGRDDLSRNRRDAFHSAYHRSDPSVDDLSEARCSQQSGACCVACGSPPTRPRQGTTRKPSDGRFGPASRRGSPVRQSKRRRTLDLYR